jgi:putative ABC transport system permease protein
MMPWVTLRIALRALTRNKMRSALTTLGVVIGVAAVIAMVSIGEGAKVKVAEAFDAMGTNLLVVRSGSATTGGMFGGAGSLPTLTWDDLDAIRTEVPTVRYAAPIQTTGATVQSEDLNWTTSVSGTTPEYFSIRNWKAAEGTLFGDPENDSGAKVAVLGRTVVEKLYGGSQDPVGRVVRIRGIPFQVIGVLEKKGQSPIGQDFDDTVMVPVTTFRAKIQGGMRQFVSGSIFVGATSSADTQRAETQIAALLRDRHRLQQGADDDFQIRNLQEMASAREQSTRTLTTLLAAIALVSLLVGGIGIMNIMLVSVTERTREIGVRMAVGAKPRDIMSQFLVEALALSVAGGLIGVALGVFLAQRLASTFEWPLLLRPDIAVVAVAFSGLVGMVFGLYPAMKASRLDPIEALRYE